MWSFGREGGGGRLLIIPQSSTAFKENWRQSVGLINGATKCCLFCYCDHPHHPFRPTVCDAVPYWRAARLDQSTGPKLDGWLPQTLTLQPSRVFFKVSFDKTNMKAKSCFVNLGHRRVSLVRQRVPSCGVNPSLVSLSAQKLSTWPPCDTVLTANTHADSSPITAFKSHLSRFTWLQSVSAVANKCAIAHFEGQFLFGIRQAVFEVK